MRVYHFCPFPEKSFPVPIHRRKISEVRKVSNDALNNNHVIFLAKSCSWPFFSSNIKLSWRHYFLRLISVDEPIADTVHVDNNHNFTIINFAESLLMHYINDNDSSSCLFIWNIVLKNLNFFNKSH